MPGSARVEDAARFRLPVLFPARDVTVGRRILGSQSQRIASRLEKRRDVERERNVAAFMLAHHAAVQPDFGSIIYGAEVQQDAPALPGIGDRHATPVPNLRVEGGVSDPALQALDAEGHENRLAVLPGSGPPILGNSGVLVIELKFPAAHMLDWRYWRFSPLGVSRSLSSASCITSSPNGSTGSYRRCITRLPGLRCSPLLPWLRPSMR